MRKCNLIKFILINKRKKRTLEILRNTNETEEITIFFAILYMRIKSKCKEVEGNLRIIDTKRKFQFAFVGLHNIAWKIGKNATEKNI